MPNPKSKVKRRTKTVIPIGSGISYYSAPTREQILENHYRNLIGDLSYEEARKRAYENHASGSRVADAIRGNKDLGFSWAELDPINYSLNSIYFGQGPKFSIFDHVDESPYGHGLYEEHLKKFRDDSVKRQMVEFANDLNIGEVRKTNDSRYTQIGKFNDPNRGTYVSRYGEYHRPDIERIDPEGRLGTPVKLYDRVYLDDYYGINSGADPGEWYGGWLPQLTYTAKRGTAQKRRKKALGGSLRFTPGISKR